MELIGTCVGSDSDEINAFDDSSTQISFETAQKHIGRPELSRVFESQYVWDRRKGLKMKDDYAISFFKGKYRGQKTIVVFWSAIHYFFQ